MTRQTRVMGLVMMDLSTALDMRPGDVVAFVGAGGKTTAMFRAARELAARGHRVITTTTTMIWQPVPAQSHSVIVESDESQLLARVGRALAQEKHVTVAAYPTPVGKLKGVRPAAIEELARMADFVLVEADGARGRSLKAPTDYEPVIPAAATHVVPVVAIDAVGQPLTDEIAHRLARVTHVTGLRVGEKITAAILARALTAPEGGLKGIPAKARVFPLINKMKTEADLMLGREVARRCLGCPRVEAVLLGAVASEPPVREKWKRVSAVVLAAGASRRFGSPKQLLPVGDGILLGHVLNQLSSSWVNEIVVVLGHAAGQIERALEDFVTEGQTPWRVVVNDRWAEGQSTSLRVGLEAVSDRTEAVLFVLADQPHITAGLIDELLMRYARTGAPIVMFEHEGCLRPPVLFDRATFEELREVSGDVGGREVVRCHLEEVERVTVGSASSVIDIDTPEDYEVFVEG